MRRVFTILLAILLPTICVAIACAGGPAKPWTFNAAMLRPFWLSETMEGESVLFIKGNDAAEPKATLFFQPTKILAVCSSSGEVTYVEGKDYVWKPDTREITLPAGSKIPSKTPQDLRRPANSQLPYHLTHRDGNGEIFFGGGHEYHDMQTLVTYEHKPGAWCVPLPKFAGRQLPRTLKKLKEKQPLTIALYGDSISTGCQASSWANVPPFQPAYQDLLVMNLEAVYGGTISLKNYSLGGTGTEWGLENIAKVLEANPDLVILAFGMNNSGGPPAAHQANIKGMIDAVRKAKPETEFILVAPMLGNTDWTLIHGKFFPQYRNALSKLCGRGVALADVTSIWIELLKYKKDWDMTGNGVNHPNDFGHRVYAQVLSSLLINNPKTTAP